MFDQRAIVTNPQGQVVYRPRANLDGLTPEFREWLAEHKAWDSSP